MGDVQPATSRSLDAAGMRGLGRLLLGLLLSLLLWLLCLWRLLSLLLRLLLLLLLHGGSNKQTRHVVCK